MSPDHHPALRLNQDRLLPADPATRSLARRILMQIRDLPILSPHGHVDPGLLLRDEPFADPASLFITKDHYVTRLLHANGVPLADLRVGADSLPEVQAREVWRLLCENWALLRGTPVRLWFEQELAEIFGITVVPSAQTSDAIFDQLAAALKDPAYSPRALFSRFRIEVLATTDDPADDLAAHRALAADPDFPGRVIPTWRPDRYLEMATPGWAKALRGLAAAADVEIADLATFTQALRRTREHFIAHGAVTTDHSHLDAVMHRLDDDEAAALFRAGMSGQVTSEQADAFRRHMMWQMAAMSADDGLVMTLHPGVVRGHHGPTTREFGPDTGNDLPIRVEFTHALREVLNDFGTHPRFRMVLFTLDETTWGREIAPLAGFYPSVFVGAPWWFLDAPESIRRFRAATTEIAGFSRMSGFIDDTRAFCSIPARHDMSRRLDAGALASLVVDGRLDEDEAIETAIMLTSEQPRRVFNL